MMNGEFDIYYDSAKGSVINRGWAPVLPSSRLPEPAASRLRMVPMR